MLDVEFAICVEGVWMMVFGDTLKPLFAISKVVRLLVEVFEV